MNNHYTRSLKNAKPCNANDIAQSAVIVVALLLLILITT